ncbi:DISARM system helicase DrmA [Azospirillum brasilense]|uniref:DISARM system helicase DrmA n=1 Tax=Azospirillum brasilense TaxID=192 RepID=UPI000E6A4ABB|nr:DISARM system helicase DrmA [Azospirillum brasilense]NUB23340.1 helicase [Azospirillum brasilense]NUB30962.1 helicase [Azospirillum brasilense]RIW05655.1 helicase [Azospirillum brasilense]
MLTNSKEGAAAQAWLLKRTNNFARYSIRMNSGTKGLGAIEEGHWVLVVSDDGRATDLGRVMRIRSDLGGATIHFDRWQAVDPSVPLVEIGLTAPKGPAARLPWDDFLRVLPLLGVAKPDAVPPIEDVVYVRDLLELAVRDDLLGPAGGPHELIKDMSVRDRYLVGKLAPRRPDDALDAHVEPASAAEEIGDLEDERSAPLHEPGAEFASASGRVEPEDDALEEIDTTNNQSLVPSSMGLTFCVASDVQILAVDAQWGRYERVPNDEHDFVKTRRNSQTGREEQIKVKIWRRIPCGGVVTLPLVDGQIKPSTPDRDQPDVRLQGAVRTNNKGERLVTLFLVNGQLEPEDNKDRAWLFQPEITVEAADSKGDRSVFRRRPSNEVVVDDPERDRLALIYRNRLEFAVGHGVSVHAETVPEDPSKAYCVRTEIIPRYEVAVTETPGLDPRDRPAMRRMVSEGWLDMMRLAEMEPDELREALSCLTDDYAVWIGEQKTRLGTDIAGFDDPGKDVLIRCGEVLHRLRQGMDTLFTDAKALEAFRFANRSMAMQRVRSIYALKRRRSEAVDTATLDVAKNRSWRPFQLAFLLLSVPSLADPAHPDRTKPVEAFADLLWFPTGGGKTEAYLGVAAFAMAMRRLKNDLGGLDASRGLAVIMRYTLRLLTLQQFQRATTLLCAMEVIRRADDGTWGKEPFSLGLWVGNRVTPGTTEASHQAVQAIRNNDRNKTGIASPAQLTSCPWCGSEISGGRDIEVDRIAGRTLIYCGDKLGSCDFSKAKSSSQPHPGLPVKVVDEEIYHRPPTMMIATVDKFAMMAWRPEVRTLFGRIDQECGRHGLLWPSHGCGTGHQARGGYPAARVKLVRTIRPPDLIIQDEFHLISGPLGTMVGLYETAVDELSSWTLGDRKVRPKVVASTATVRRADDQVRNVFMRRISVFPPSGLDVEDNFFSVQRPISEKPGRRYIGVCAPGSSRPAVLIRTYTAFLTAAQALFDRFGPVADPYMTLVGYFNSLRELGGMKRLAEDDVQTRSFRVNMSLVDRPGLSQRRVEEVNELTSRVSSQDIPRHLDQLEVPFDGMFDPAQGKWVTNRKPGEARPIDAVLATNMLSVGVDVNRLGVMVVNGQPKGTAEYIQATSRVGRTPPGLVATVLTWARPRDLSHYETFEHYHATFYQHVEAQSVTPFSPRALDRGLTGALLSIMRHAYGPFAANDGAGAMNSPSRNEMLKTIDVIAARTWEVTEDSGKKALTEAEMKSRADDWANEAGVGGRTLVYQKHGAGPTAYPLLSAPGIKPWTDWTVPMSMREVEPGVRLVMEDDRSMSDPTWRPRVTKSEGDQ